MDTANTAREMDNAADMVEIDLTGEAANDNVVYPKSWQEGRLVDEATALQPGDVLELVDATGNKIQVIMKSLGLADVREVKGSAIFNRGVVEIGRRVQKGGEIALGESEAFTPEEIVLQKAA